MSLRLNLAALAVALNLLALADHYAFISTPDGQPISSDAITVGLLYRLAHLGNASSQITILDRPKAMVSLGAIPARLGEIVSRLSIPVVRTGDLTQPLRVMPLRAR
jgi:hypothetical protein